MDKTIQRGDLGKHGILFKIVPMHSEMKPSDNDLTSCWCKPLLKWLPRAGQSVIPTNLSEFKVFLLDDSLNCFPFYKCNRTLSITYSTCQVYVHSNSKIDDSTRSSILEFSIDGSRSSFKPSRSSFELRKHTAETIRTHLITRLLFPFFFAVVIFSKLELLACGRRRISSDSRKYVCERRLRNSILLNQKHSVLYGF